MHLHFMDVVVDNIIVLLHDCMYRTHGTGSSVDTAWPSG